MKLWALGLLALLAACSGPPARQADAGPRVGATIVPGPANADPSSVYVVSKYCTSGSPTTPTTPCAGWETTLNALGTAYEAYFPPGSYKLAARLNIKPGSYVHGAGDGQAVITTSSSYVGGAFRAAGTANGADSGNLTIADLSLVNGNASTNTHSVGLEITSLSIVNVERVAVSGFWRNVAADQAERTKFSDLSLLLNNQFTGSTSTPPTGVSVTPHGTPASITYAFEVAADFAGGSSVSVGAVTQTGAAAPNVTDFLRVAWTAPSGSPTGYDIWLTYIGPGGSGTLGKVGHVSSGGTVQFDYTGQHVDNSSPPETQANLWIVNGPNLNAGNIAGFSNAIDVERTNFNSTLSGAAAAIHILNDGGNQLNIEGGTNFNGGDLGIRAAGAQPMKISGCYSEGQASAWLELNEYPLDMNGPAVANAGGFNNVSLVGNFVSNGHRPAILVLYLSNIASIGNLYVGDATDVSGENILGGANISRWQSVGDGWISAHLFDTYPPTTPSAYSALTVSSHAYATEAGTCLTTTCSFSLTLENGQSDTLSNPTGLSPGFDYRWIITQNNTGASTLAYGSAFDFPGGVAQTVSSTLGAVSILQCTYDNIKLRCEVYSANAPASRTLTAGTGLTGGGDLSADRSFAIDTSVVPQLGSQNTFTKAFGSTTVALTASSHAYATDASLSNVFKVPLEAGQSDTLSNPTGLADGYQYQWRITQNASASTLAFGSKFKWPSGVTPTVTTSSGAVDLVSCTYFSDTDILDCAFSADGR